MSKSKGESVQAVVTENHADHIKSHMSVIASPEAKEDERVLSVTLAHIQEHLDVWQDASINNPAILLATGQQPLPPPQPQMPPGMPPAGGPAGPGAPAPSGGPGPMKAPDAALGEMQPKAPNLPTNPATGEEPAIPGVNA